MARGLTAMILLGLAVGACGGGDDGDGPTSAVVSPRAGFVCGVLFEVQLRLGDRIRGATPDALDLAAYTLQADGTFASPGTTCNERIAAALTRLCDRCQSAPGDCEPEVRALFREVPPECSRCGDEVCYGGESVESCAPDCAASCGDGVCSPLELAVTCPMDCAVACGDGRCSTGEDDTICPVDCRFAAGDGVCAPGETPENSPQDCGFATCGDGFCQTYEDALRCGEDCCWPRVCSEDYRRCRDAHQIEVCERSGAGACPELVVGEECPLGCIDDPLGVGTRCRTCAELLADTFTDSRYACDPDAGPRCAGTARVTCQALAGFPGCGYEVREDCAGGTCLEGACIQCEAGCALAFTRCGEEGATLEGCRVVAPGCQQWATLRACADGCTGSATQAHCIDCHDTGCPEGEICFGDGGCLRCSPDDCLLYSRRCATDPSGAVVVEHCQSNADCTGWVPLQTCPEGVGCTLDREGNATCGGGG